MQDLVGLYLKQFCQDYLSTPEDRRRLWETLLNAGLIAAVIIAAALALWML